MKLASLVLGAGIILLTSAASAAGLTVDLTPDAGNPASPQMGDQLSFHTVMRNTGATPLQGLLAWISLVQVDQGEEQPVDLEDWSAHKAVVAASLEPGQAIRSEWPMRLIQAGTYRVAVIVATRDSSGLVASPLAGFTVRRRPVVESWRVLPVAVGVPLLIGVAMLWKRARR